MMTQLKYVLTCFLIVLWICSCNSAQAGYENENKSVSCFRNAHTEKQRLRACINAIDHRLIYVGMDIVDLDNLLGSEFARDLPPKGEELSYSTYKFSKAEFAWRLLLKHNRQGIVVDYYLNNLTYKGYSSTEPPKAHLAKIAASFRNAKSHTQKLACAIHAIDTRVIKNGTLKSTLHTIFGDSSEEKEVRPGWYSSSYLFGPSQTPWRLVVCGDSQFIFHYFLTNSQSNLCI